MCGALELSRESHKNSDTDSFEAEHNLSQSIDHKLSHQWEECNEKAPPYDYVASMPGKEIRRQLLNALNHWFQVDEISSNIIAETVTMMHNASLLIDDIQDNSQLRRGFPSAHQVYGVAQTINSANYVYFQAQQHLLQHLPKGGGVEEAAIIRIFNEEMLNLHRGQGMELYWRDTMQLPPSEAEYLQMVSNKTGGLFRLILRLLRVMSPVEHVMAVNVDVISKVVDVMGLQFQILDDLKNICDEKMAKQKGFFDDLTEGKFSYPIAHAIWKEKNHNTPPSPENSSSERKHLLIEFLAMRTQDNTIKIEAIQCLQRAGSLNHTKQVLKTLDQRARFLMGEVGVKNPLLEKVLDQLVDGLGRMDVGSQLSVEEGGRLTSLKQESS
ncbi:terpenoid synthase [Sphaerulina musiva SO2202]|uniref:Terpenoid synthase n=1 Tax=Sphaerulina musiva (strain SO2202) TaxID=692275 RepID=N1QFW5_SPHMS|nr:terpenoid synthase [Sphaerulina musiva SO2202]EMF09423.1 terpenoid synthase [Sphaerulina musiva SO2202]